MTTSAAAPLASRRILVVDDQPSIRGILELALTEAGADVWTAEDGSAALRSIEESLPDLILLDLVMPGLNGWDVIQALSASPRTAAIPVVLETSAEDYGSFDRAKKQGVAAFISKPFRLGEVIETCRRILSGARPLQGTKLPSEASAPVQLRDKIGNLIGVGHLLDEGLSGAQIESDTPLSLGQSVTLTYRGPGGLVTLEGQVRWLTRAGGAYHLGLSVRRP
jgi:CheY-like chemotaxis protein